MAQSNGPQSEPPPRSRNSFDGSLDMDASSVPNQQNEGTATDTTEPPSQAVTDDPEPDQRHGRSQESMKPGTMRRISRSVVPGLPRAQTFKRQLSEQRCHLDPVELNPAERRAVSMDRRLRALRTGTRDQVGHTPGIKDHELNGFPQKESQSHISSSLPRDPYEEEPLTEQLCPTFDDKPEDLDNDAASHDDFSDARSIASSRYDIDNMIHDELETTWILNLSMRYKDHSNREKFFVTYRENDHNWRRVTVTLDYRNAPENSLEMELFYTRLQRDKSRKIYEAIRDSLPEIKFYGTVTNLKLETLDERLHVHVVEDGNEIIHYPRVSQLAHLSCRRIRERDLVFDHHMSGFVYKVSVAGEPLIKKEIPGPDTIDEFLYEINALNSLTYSDNVIKFYGLVVDEYDEHVKGLLISYADGGALVDIIYDNCKDKRLGLQWSLKERWARQIVHGLADVHESGFVQGDFTLSNIVIDEQDHAKIIDINRRGCPVGWEPPEATPLIESHHRISMYIGVKSDLYQLGMVLWALAMEEDEPEREGRPLTFGPESRVPEWYQQVAGICLDPDPRKRLHASMLLQLFPEEEQPPVPQISINDSNAAHSFAVQEFNPDGRPRMPPGDLPSKWWTNGRAYTPTGPPAYQSWNYAPRGRSPPSPLPSNFDEGSVSAQRFHGQSAWAANRNIRSSYSDVDDEERVDEVAQQLSPSAPLETGPLPLNQDIVQAEPQHQEAVDLSGPAHENTEERVVVDLTEPLAAEHVLATTDKGDDAADPEEAPTVEGQTPVADGALRDISPNIMRKTGTVQEKYEDPCTATGPALDIPTEEDYCRNAPIVSDNNTLTEAGTCQADKAEPVERTVSPLEGTAPVDDPTLSEQKDQTDTTMLVSSEANENGTNGTNGTQIESGDADVPTEHEPEGLAKSLTAISRSESGALSDTKNLSPQAVNETTEMNTDSSSMLPGEASLTQESVESNPNPVVDEDAVKLQQEQGVVEADSIIPADDSREELLDAGQGDSSASANPHAVALDAPVPDSETTSTPQGDAAGIGPPEPNPTPTVAQNPTDEQERLIAEKAISSAVSVNTAYDSQKSAGCITHPTPSTDEAPTQSEARSQLVQDTTNYDATPRISPCGKLDDTQLFGVGGHMPIDDSYRCEKDIFNEDFLVGPRDVVIPSIIMTTDAT